MLVSDNRGLEHVLQVDKPGYGDACWTGLCLRRRPGLQNHFLIENA